MIKKKVSVNKKDTEHGEQKPVRGRPRTNTKPTDADITVPRLPSSRVFSVSIENNVSGINRTNNIIRLKLKISNINKLEGYIADNKTAPAGNFPAPMGTETDPAGMMLSEWAKTDPEPETVKKPDMRAFAGLESFIKLRSIGNASVPKQTEDKPNVNRKDLIINSGIKRTTQEPLQVFADTWPLTSPYACWYCCHTFDTTPVGIPSVLTNYMFKCYGNFCSYNCAKRYLCPLKDDEDDMAAMQSSNDIFRGDDQGEKLQLLELLYHLETNAEMDEPIKTAPRRLVLKMFGGTKTIEEFRKSFKTNTVYHTFKMPLASMAYHMEECVDTKSDVRRKLKNMSLDVARLEQAYDELMREKKRNAKLSIQKVMTRDQLQIGQE